MITKMMAVCNMYILCTMYYVYNMYIMKWFISGKVLLHHWLPVQPETNLLVPFLWNCMVVNYTKVYPYNNWCVCVCVCVLVSHVWLFVIPWTVACQAPLSMNFSRQEYWSGLPFPSPGDFPTLGWNPGLLHCKQTLYHLSHQGSSCNNRKPI